MTAEQTAAYASMRVALRGRPEARVRTERVTGPGAVATRLIVEEMVGGRCVRTSGVVYDERIERAGRVADGVAARHGLCAGYGAAAAWLRLFADKLNIINSKA